MVFIIQTVLPVGVTYDNNKPFRKTKKLEQRKNRLKQLDASLSVQERKQRTRRLIALGGLVSKAKLEDWNANALLGGLLFLKEREADNNQMNDWVHKGGVAFSAEKAKTSET